MSRTVKVPCCDAAGENTSPRTGGSNHPGLAKGAKPLRLHINTSKGFFTAQVLSSWASRTVLFVERTTDRAAEYEYGEARQAGGQICGRCVAVWPVCGRCVAAGQLLEYQPCVPPPKYSSTNQFFKTTYKSICIFCPKTYICSAENETGLLKEVPFDCWETPFPNNSCQSEAACLCGTS